MYDQYLKEIFERKEGDKREIRERNDEIRDRKFKKPNDKNKLAD